jgi:hypothetical protein
MSECRNCDVHRFIACKNGLVPSGCHGSEISPLYSAEPQRCSLASSGEFLGGAGRRAGNAYDDVQERIRTLLKKIQDLRDQEDIDSTQALLDAGDKYFKLEAEVNQYIKLKSAMAKVKGQLKEKLKPRSPGEEFIQAARSAGTERPFLAELLDRQIRIWDERGLYG